MYNTLYEGYAFKQMSKVLSGRTEGLKLDLQVDNLVPNLGEISKIFIQTFWFQERPVVDRPFSLSYNKE